MMHFHASGLFDRTSNSFYMKLHQAMLLIEIMYTDDIEPWYLNKSLFNTTFIPVYGFVYMKLADEIVTSDYNL